MDKSFNGYCNAISDLGGHFDFPAQVHLNRIIRSQFH
jgi:hypothetical protein